MAKKKLKKSNGSSNKPIDGYNEGDLVCAKVRGYPFWPGFIENVEPTKSGPKYTIRFFGTNDSYCMHNCKQIKPFASLTEGEKSCNKKGFQEGLALCQERYDSIRLATDKESGSPQSACSKSSPPTVQNVSRSRTTTTTTAKTTTTTAINGIPNIKRESIENEATEHEPESERGETGKVTTRKRARSAARISDEFPKLRDAKPTKYLKVSAKPELRVPKNVSSEEGESRAEPGSVQTEGENLKATPDRATTLAKLKRKIDKKEEEKRDLKRMMMKDKAKMKVPKVEKIIHKANNVLGRFLLVSRAVQKAQTDDQDRAQFTSMLQWLQEVLPALSNSINVTNYSGFSWDQGEYSKFSEIFAGVATELSDIEDSERIPIELRESVGTCRKKIMKDEIIMRFLQERDKMEARNKTILERRDNDANSGRIISKRRK